MDDFLEYANSLYVETFVFEKDNQFGFLYLVLTGINGMIAKFDPRKAEPTITYYQTEEDAVHWLQKSIKTTVRNGWRLIHKGKPNYG